MKSRQEGGQDVGRLLSARGGGAVGGLARCPGGDDPGAWKPLGGLAEELRDGNWQRKVWGKGGQPGVLLAQQRVRRLRHPGQPNGEVVAEPPHLTVPATRTKAQRAIGQFGVLVSQKIPYRLRGDLDLGVGHAKQR
ncbi:hypothetical protein GCM10027162_03190 [Streptomyces incanus]